VDGSDGERAEYGESMWTVLMERGQRYGIKPFGVETQRVLRLEKGAEYGESMWTVLMERGQRYGIKPFGVETQRVLRLEKGHILPGTDTDALTNPYEAGVDFTIKEDKPDFLGKAFLAQSKARGIRDKLIAYQLKPGDPIPDDGVVILDAGRLIGRVTSSRLSPTLGHGIGLGWVEKHYAEPGTPIEIRLANGQSVWGQVLEGHSAYDPRGERLRL
jgi:sarcosine oxidase subunit alpha